ncbi:lysophospholipid acyltransferase 7 [Bradysia coprophila]|uniref:lysophospholipid acyltransferase 7 n=1 Tax=Bradysia coprophila TaxID=38358 RepID=UPI00187D7B7F|nr:lysophospholipid acyltransferase 7 [Bradysia coprophila]
MNFDDIIYVSLLVSCILFGKFYNQFDNGKTKKVIGTTFGLVIIFVVSGRHIVHPLVSCLGCALCILFVNKRHCHIASFAFMFTYLILFRMMDTFGYSAPSGHTNMVQMILTLKLVGLAFERNLVLCHSDGKENGEERDALENITFVDIFHYSFNYIGVLTGPYFRYRTFNDYFTLPFKHRANNIGATISKITLIPLFAAVYLLVSYLWPLSYTDNPEFYNERSTFYRLMYVWPLFLTFRMRIYIGITLSECVCTMAGFGAYPVDADNAPGYGPRKEYKSLTAETGKYSYDFETIHNVDAYTTDTCWTFREAMKSWNMCVQYWLAMNVYKRFPSKQFRTHATLLVSALWHGVYPGYYFCIFGAPFYLPIEDIYNKLIRKSAEGFRLQCINVAFWISKFFAFSYLGIAFQLLTIDRIWFYYNSVYHLGYIYFAVMFIIGKVCLSMQKRPTSTKNDRTKSTTPLDNDSTTGKTSKLD